ncbi:LysR family transcriptional regulator [Tateyamaria sp. SN3-11]|uniref:LysR family transcriptional regulator n=1 Tax=Tateyamaria sp. SN3-11 TaxID=3092147 RepID=UPI0039E7A37B
MKNLNLNALRVFAVSARHGSFQRAAQELHITHGAVSQRIKQLELDLGVVLFDRHPRGVSLTARGQQYCAAVNEALAILTAATADLERANAQITLHLGPSFATKWLMPRMQAFRAQFPDVSLATEIHGTLMERNLGRNEIAIWPASQAHSNGSHHVQHLCAVQLVAVCNPQFPRPSGPLDTDALLRLPLLQDLASQMGGPDPKHWP